jgi:hypothetical protein
MSGKVLAGLVVVVSIASGAPQQPSEPGFWTGRFEIYQFNLSHAVGVEDKSLVSRGVDVWQDDYELYQNPAGVTREELVHTTGQRSIEAPHDVRLLDYARGFGVVFDKAGRQGIRGPFAPVRPRPLAPRRILGFDCEGREHEWTTFQHARVELQSWRARSSSFRAPLLEVEYFTDDTGALIALTVRFVSKVGPGAQMPASLFDPPVGLHVVDVPSIR